MVSFCWCIFQLLQCTAKLVGTRGVLCSTTDAVKPTNDVVDVLAADELTDTLQVAVATSKEEYLLDDVVLVGCHVNQA